MCMCVEGRGRACVRAGVCVHTIVYILANVDDKYSEKVMKDIRASMHVSIRMQEHTDIQHSDH